jgi:Uma2 family endonuclease
LSFVEKDQQPTQFGAVEGARVTNMTQAVAASYVPFEDYLEAELHAETSSPKCEWFAGAVYAMSRGTPEHGRLTSRMTVALAKVLPADCEIYSGDTMLFVAEAELATYADLTVVCGPLQTHTVRKGGKSLGQAVVNPVVIVEVLSDSTERYDRDGKFQAYKLLPSLEEYVLVSQDRRQVEVFRKAQGWKGELSATGQTAQVHGATIHVDNIYG